MHRIANKPWGYHLMLDCSRCVPSSIRSKSHIETFATNLVKNIDMVAYGTPQVVHFGSGNKAGYTLVQLIETSNICAHFVEETDDMFLDVFSCKEFSNAEVSELVKKYFEPLTIRPTYLLRYTNSTQDETKNGSYLNTSKLM
jgi:S-adenosylmethionine/arginine decarboxylase-like enzyme